MSVDLSALHISVLAQCCYVLHRQASPIVGGEYRAGSTLCEPEETLCLAPPHTHTHTQARTNTPNNTHSRQATLGITAKQNRMYIKKAVSPPLYLFLSLHRPSEQNAEAKKKKKKVP